MEAIRNDFDTWKERINSQFEEAKTIYDDKFEGLEQKAQDSISKVKDIFDNDFNEYVNKTNESKESINQDIIRLTNESEKLLGTLHSSYQELLTENQQKINSQKTEIDNSLETTKTEIQQMLMKMQSDTNNLNKSMDAIDKRLKDFVEQSKVFDKADELKAELKTDISDLKAAKTNLQKSKR